MKSNCLHWYENIFHHEHQLAMPLVKILHSGVHSVKYISISHAKQANILYQFTYVKHNEN
jgi:hypothetical protein